MSDCLFCKIIHGEIPSKTEYQDDDVFAFHDINPQAPIHLLVVPKKHIAKVGDLEKEHISLMGTLLLRAKEIAARKGCNDYRLVFNNGPQAQQTVYHIHLHLISGRQMSWPPG